MIKTNEQILLTLELLCRRSKKVLQTYNDRIGEVNDPKFYDNLSSITMEDIKEANKAIKAIQFFDSIKELYDEC
jgi:hypothetical protein